MATRAIEHTHSTAEIEHFIAGFLQGPPEIERVLVSSVDRAVHVWSIVNNIPRERLYSLYDLEETLMGKFPHTHLNFHVIDRRDTPAERLIPGAKALFQR
jgi:hypothetical protein